MAITVQQTKFEVLEEGMYTLTVVEMTDETGQYGRQIKTKFAVEGHDGVSLLKWFNFKFCPKSGLYEFTRTVLGTTTIPEGLDFTDDLVMGRKVGALVKVYQKDGQDRNKIEAFFPIKQAKPAAQGTPPQAQAATAMTESGELPF